ncbi:MAG TPA: hypothetical protein VES01_02875 [Dermatophilaceae bacterium]|nr:hypothetical protein [Dermatophilaceae bacterium]
MSPGLGGHPNPEGGSTGSAHGPVPPGWPASVPPPSVPEWQPAAVAWLLDHCPADYRGYDGWVRYPVALAWIATRHVDGQVEVMREAYRRARVELADHLDPEGLSQVLATIEREGLRLRAAAQGARMISQALEGLTWVPRL